MNSTLPLQPRPGNGPDLDWRPLADAALWDARLARLGGHPLQSALWGEARRRADGRSSLYLGGTDSEGELVALSRIEERRLPLLGKVAWLPRGPVCAAGGSVWHGLCPVLAAHGFVSAMATPWQEATAVQQDASPTRTIWLDLRIGEDALLGNLDSQFRYGARRALREGVQVTRAQDAAMVARFHALCDSISEYKRFSLSASASLMQHLLDLTRADAPVQAHLFVATHEGRLAAGAFILRAGRHVHYLWGAVDRQYPGLRAGEVVQWAVIEWAVRQGCTLYDLEGIDPVNNPGTYQFKKKLGGREVQLARAEECALNWRGALVRQALDLRRKIDACRRPRPGGKA